MKTKKKKKKKLNPFVPQVEEWLLSIGAKRTPDALNLFSLDTKAGRLGITPRENIVAGGPGCVFCRFDDPDAAQEILGIRACNPYSGKWNHHYFDPWTLEAALKDLKYWFRNI